MNSDPSRALRTSVLIPSFARAAQLRQCLEALNRQTHLPDEALIVWQADDLATRDEAEQFRSKVKFDLRVIHLPSRGIVPAENAALDASTGDVILLIDDDAIAAPDWLARHLAHYSDSTIGAVGGPAVNHYADGSAYPIRAREPIGKLRCFGRAIGNMFDHPIEWRSRAPIDVDHLVGYNMSLRRSAFDRFDERLKPYWQMFEMEACLQVKSRGFRVRFDFANVVDHFPTNTVYSAGRQGDLDVKIYNAAYNHSYILAKHHPSITRRLAQKMFLYGVGSVNAPGLLGAMVGVARFGRPSRELEILSKTFTARRAAERDARRGRI